MTTLPQTTVSTEAPLPRAALTNAIDAARSVAQRVNRTAEFQVVEKLFERIQLIVAESEERRLPTGDLSISPEERAALASFGGAGVMGNLSAVIKSHLLYPLRAQFEEWAAEQGIRVGPCLSPDGGVSINPWKDAPCMLPKRRM